MTRHEKFTIAVAALSAVVSLAIIGSLAVMVL